MILVDFSSTIHRMIHTSISNVKPTKEGDKYKTSEFIGLTKYYILQDLFNIKREHGTNFGDLVICLDRSSNGYWRKDFYPGYKVSRKKNREVSIIDYYEVFAEIDQLIEQIRINLPWKIVEVQKAEADDIMLVLSREYNKFEKILLFSPDKDMLQAQRDTDNVKQYSSLTKKWMVPENKHDHMEHWILEHVCLGDAGDEIPKVVDHTEFADSFLEYLVANGIQAKSPHEFIALDIPKEEKKDLLNNFDLYKTNRKGESTGEKDIYRDISFGPSTLKKKIAEFGSLEAWLASHPLYKKNYDRNFKLIMEEGIPVNIWNEIIINYKEAKTDYNHLEFEKYLIDNNLKSIILELPNVFKITRPLTAEDYGW